MNPIVVSAPLNINNLLETDIDNIYIFDYNKSFLNSKDKPLEILNYIESLSSMCDILIDDVPYKEKEELILNYFNSNIFYNLYSLTKTMIDIIFRVKYIYHNNTGILNQTEIDLFIKNNKEFIERIIKFYDSLFIFMLIYATTEKYDIMEIKKSYTKELLINDLLSPNICNVLLCKEFYLYYESHIDKNNIYFYNNMFIENIYKGKSFIDIITNDNNETLKLLFKIKKANK